jgi:glycosyltransferase involved in cell wall biosynthesis
MKILISAYACSPFQGSEPSSGWGFAYELAKTHELTVFVEEEKFRSDIEQYLRDNDDHARKIEFIYVKKVRNRWLRKIWPPSYYWYFRDWHKRVLSLAQNLNTLQEFDLVHQLNMSGFREPGYLWKLDLPFVWGPVGGMGYFPVNFLNHIGLKGFFYHLAYNVYNFFHMSFLIRPKTAAKKASIGLISATSDNQQRFKEHWSSTSTLISEIGQPYLASTNPINKRQKGQPLRIVWSGQHTPGKALNIALRALALIPKDMIWELHILGSGQLTNKWKDYAESLEISNACLFHGMVDRQKALEIMNGAHLVLITSLRDLTSAVTVESISLGLPVICLDHSGFSDVIDDTCGIKIPLTNFNQVTLDLSAAIQKLALDDGYRTKLSLGALKRAERYSWENKVKTLDGIYQNKLNQFHANQ